MKILKILTATICTTVLLGVMTAITTFILTIFMPENVVGAIEIVKNLLGMG